MESTTGILWNLYSINYIFKRTKVGQFCCWTCNLKHSFKEIFQNQRKYGFVQNKYFPIFNLSKLLKSHKILTATSDKFYSLVFIQDAWNKYQQTLKDKLDFKLKISFIWYKTYY